ncbi:hypothetical protein AB0O52_08390 [Arthrobacter sp. NPDC080073]
MTVNRLMDSSRVIFDAVDNCSTVVMGLAYQRAKGRAELVSTAGVI